MGHGFELGAHDAARSAALFVQVADMEKYWMFEYPATDVKFR